MRIVRWLAIPALVIIGAGAVWISTSDSVGRSSTPATALTSTAEVTTISQDVAATGTVQPAAQYALAFGAEPVVATGTTSPSASTSRTWTVTDVAVALGDRVTQGQVLATADTADVQADIDALAVQIADAQQTLDDATTTRDDARTTTRQKLATAYDDLEVAQLNYTNAKVSYADAASGSPKRQSRVGLIQAKAQVETAQQSVADLQEQLSSGFPDETQAVADAQSSLADLQTQLADLQQQLDLATLRAPVDGVVSEVDITPGYTAPSGTALVVDSGTLQVVADVVESDYSSIALGQAATVT
ncbi:MAG: HlyD family efflux transporter periplasmic adaptor subunit, partial [Chloroflexota bacterium]